MPPTRSRVGMHGSHRTQLNGMPLTARYHVAFCRTPQGGLLLPINRVQRALDETAGGSYGIAPLVTRLAGGWGIRILSGAQVVECRSEIALPIG